MYFGVKIIVLTNRSDFMLLRTGKHGIICCFLLCVLAFCLLQCKSAGSTETVNENPYLADYEKPAQPWGYIDIKGNLTIGAEFDDVSPFSEGLAAAMVDGRWGYIDKQGSWTIPPQYHQAWSFHNERARVKPFDQGSHFIDRTGRIIRSADWVAEDDFAEGLARIRYGDHYGYVDTSGAIVINPAYSRAWNFENGIAIIEMDGKMGAINTKGNLIIRAKFESITRNLTRDRLLAHEGVKAILYNTVGKELLQLAPAKMLDCDSFNVVVKRGELKWLYHLTRRNWQPDHGFLQLINLGESRWAAKSAGGYQLLDKNGSPVNPLFYTQLNRFESGIAAFQRDEYWGYVTVDGVELIEPQFGLAWDFKEGLARAAFRDGIGFITADMQLAFYPPENTMDMRDFSEGLAPVQMSGW